MQSPNRPSPQKFIKHAADVASSFGFRPAREIERTARAVKGHGIERARMHNFVTVSTVCTACTTILTPEPALAWWATPAPTHLPAGVAPREVGEFGLHIAGSSESVGEVVLLKTLATITTEWGAPLARIRLNALGDRDSKLRYSRELSFYFRKHIASLCEQCRAKAPQDPLAPFSCPQESCRSVAEGAPRAMNFLSEKSRAHFRDVLEHIEGLGLPYELDDLLVSDERESQLLFALDFAGPDATIEGAMGGRFDDYVRRQSNRKEAVGLSASIFFRKTGLASASFGAPLPVRQPRVFFVQLGLRAKLQGLSVIDDLRHAQVPVVQTFDAAKLSPQLAAARAAGVSHLIIMGQREALDRTVIVREINNSAQTIIQLQNLPRFLKTLR
ncbi:MAG: His/Gly/Thr/Pro-type tRNA ligase C-terminal domain-containing protein [Patescibacteria group bacterium]|mgnify:CR=1 FL=1